MSSTEASFEEIFYAMHNALERHFRQVWKSEISDKERDEERIRADFLGPRESLKRVCKECGLHPGSILGTYLEWTFFHFLREGLKAFKKDTIAEVKNRHQIPHPDKKKLKGVSKLNLDLAIKKTDSSKIFYAFEIKTNFDDGFSKYRLEEKLIYHHRKKVFGDFKYYYVCVNDAGSELFKKDISTLKKRGEIYCLGRDSDLPTATKFLSAVRKAIEEIR